MGSPSLQSSKNILIWHLRTLFCCKLGSVKIMVGLSDFEAFPKFHDSIIIHIDEMEIV